MSPPRVYLGPPPMQHAALLRELQRWVERGWLRELDRSFAAFVAQQSPAADTLLILAAALTSHQLGRGHACLDLAAVLADAATTLSLPPDDAGGAGRGEVTATPAQLLAGIDLPRWLAALDEPALVGEGDGTTPLVRAGARLYLRRYWRYERSVRAAIAQRVTPNADAAPPDAPLVASQARRALAGALDALFPRRAGAAAPDWQKIACALAARRGFGIITGGPGTGKTTTVVKLLAVLQHLALSESHGARGLRIRLAAPTGKAAARLNESIAGAVAQLPLQALPEAEQLRAAIPTEVTTVHRLLGSRPDTRRFRHDERNPLALDVLVIDEASMLDLEMMAAVFAALPPQARLILLGDKDQLASVEAGAVLGDLCQRADDGHYLPETADWLQEVAGERLEAALCDAGGRPLDQVIAKLRVSHRFSADSGIGRLAEAVNAGDGTAARRVFIDGGFADLAWQRRFDDDTLGRLAIDGAPEGFAEAGSDLASPCGYRRYLDVMREQRPPDDSPMPSFDDWANAVLRAYGRFQLLCALRNGPQGVIELNRRIAALLREQGLLDAELGGWYEGRPVLVTRNDYALGLMNGDVGVALRVPAPALAASDAPAAPPAVLRATLRVAFADGSGGIRWVLPSRLRAVETVFAMTVHKSQGSEFSHAALLLPERSSPVLTRELVYTGITRARHWFTLLASDERLQDAVQRRVERTGGLMDADEGPVASRPGV
ncbi:MAG: exodeoxyribonuclease V subunit alpha [Burkholderiaceae bacterium]